MTEVAKTREEISELWHQNLRIWLDATNHTLKDKEKCFAFCAGRDWMKDTCEALSQHRQKGFSSGSHSAYLGFRRVLQAAFIQQDAIEQLYSSTFGNKLPREFKGQAWDEMRDTRSFTVGHPTNEKVRGKQSARWCVSCRQTKSHAEIANAMKAVRGRLSTELGLKQ
jgi:hypothetical protein